MANNNKKAITDLSRNLPDMIRSQVDLKIKEEMDKMTVETDTLKELFNGIEKNVIELLKWKAQGWVCHRDEVVGFKWASAMLALTNSDNSASFENLIAVCLWAKRAFFSAKRQENVKRFLGK